MDEIIRLKKDILDLQKKQPESADASTSLEMLSKP
jgi:putative membrane protein